MSAPTTTLAKLLATRRDEVLARWLEHVRRRSDPTAALSADAQLGHLPEFLARLHAARQRGARGLASLPDLEASAGEHAAVRRRQGLDLDAVVRDFDLLREVLYDMLEETGYPPPLADLRELSQALTAGVAGAAAHFLAAGERAADARLHTIIDRAPSAIAIKDRDGRHLIANRRAAELLGRTRDQVLGRTDAELLPSELAATIRAADERALAGPVEAEEVRPGVDGLRTFHAIRFPLIDDAGRATAVCSIARDVSEQRALTAERERAVRRERAALTTAEQALAQLDAFFAAAPVGLGLVDTDLRFVRLNDTLAAMNGVPRDAHVGRRVAEIIPAPAGERTEALFRRILATREPTRNMTFWSRNAADPARRHWLANYFPVLAPGGDPLGVAGVVVELTELTRLGAERELALDALEHGDAFFLLDREFRYVLVNQAHERLSRRPRDQTLGRALWDIWPDIAGPDLKYWSEYHRCMDERVPVAFEEYFAPLDIWTEVTAYPAPSGGIAVFFRDSTPRKRAEQALALKQRELDRVFDLTPDLMCVAGFDGKMKRTNPAFAGVLGYPEGALLDAVYAEFVHPDDRATLLAEVGRLARGEPVRNFLCRVRRADGVYRWVSWRASADPDQGLFIAAGRDVTEEKQRWDFERQLIGVVSHDLRNPLGAILMSTAVALKRGGLDPQTEKLFERITLSARRAARLIEGLLDLTSARALGTMPVRPRPIELGALIDEVVEEAARTYPGRTIRCDTTGALAGEWDPDRLTQVIDNLVTNALKFSPDGADVTLTAREHGDDVVLTVHNWGPPIAPERLGTIFEAFQRGDPQGGGKPSLGLGLHITRLIAEAHRGTVSVTSTEEAGTTFTVRLPRKLPET